MSDKSRLGIVFIVVHFNQRYSYHFYVTLSVHVHGEKLGDILPLCFGTTA